MYMPPVGGGVDDVDTLSVCIGPPEHYIGLSEWGSRGTKESKRDLSGDIYLDHVEYEVQKFVSLLLKANPNVIGMLWLEPEYYLFISPSGQRLIDNRHLFASKKAHHAFSGYAYSQLKRMHSPSTGYMGKKRKQLFEAHGFDSKNAAHLIRLLRMGEEFLLTGEMNVDRSGIDAQELLSIKRGEVPLFKIEQMADEDFAGCHLAYERSPLPDEPAYDEAEGLLMSIVKTELGWD
jgi:predicted nucleotidyltransferase